MVASFSNRSCMRLLVRHWWFGILIAFSTFNRVQRLKYARHTTLTQSTDQLYRLLPTLVSLAVYPQFRTTVIIVYHCNPPDHVNRISGFVLIAYPMTKWTAESCNIDGRIIEDELFFYAFSKGSPRRLSILSLIL